MCLTIPQLSCRLFLVKHCITQVCQSPYILDLAPCDFWLFPKLKSLLKGRKFQTSNEIKENATRQLMAILKKDSADCFDKRKEHWDKCVRSQGEYFKWDYGAIVLGKLFFFFY
jgi:hypothetical protein